MVVLHLKAKGESQFLFETRLSKKVGEVVQTLVKIYNGRLKVMRIYSEVEELSRHGIAVPPNMRGLLEEQIQELKLDDQEAEICTPSGGFDHNPDPVQKRVGRAPKPDMQTVLQKTAADAMAKIGKENVKANVCLTWSLVQESLDMLKGAVDIVYPMGLSDYDPIRMEMENREELEGTQQQKDVLDVTQTVLWFASNEMSTDKMLKDYMGGNEKTKVVVKMATKSSGQPTREPVFTEEEQSRLMLANHKRREELAELERARRDDDCSHLNSRWADPGVLKNRLQGIDNVFWK